MRDLGDLLERHFARPRGRSIALVSVAERFDTEHASGRLILNVLMSVAQWEREAIAERTKAALAAKRRRGERIGEIPFGWRLAADGVHEEEDPSEQEVIRATVAYRRAGLAYEAIVERLGQDGYVARTGNPLGRTQVRRILVRAGVKRGPP